MRPAYAGLLVISILFLISLFGAYVVFRLLRGTAAIRRRGITLGGAAAGFVVFFVVLVSNYEKVVKIVEPQPAYAQDIRRLADGKPQVTTVVAMSPGAQVISDRDFKNLDRNKFTILSPEFGIAVAQPPSASWEAGKFPEFTSVSMQDIPMAAAGLQIFRALATQRPPVYGVRLLPARTVVLEGNSRIDGLAVGLNPCHDLEFVKTALLSLALPPQERAEIQSLSESVWRDLQQKAVAETEEKIRAALPITKKLHNGIFLMPFTEETSPRASLDRLLALNLYERTIMHWAFGGYGAGRGGRMHVDYGGRISSFNMSVHLESALVDGRRTDLIVNSIGFIIGGHRATYAVSLQYLSTEAADILETLRALLDSVHLAG